MARVSTSSASTSDSIDGATEELTKILRRLQDSILHPSPERERQLRRSDIEREKLASNLEFINTRLSQLEQAAATAPSKSNSSPRLAKQRDVLELLLDRLKDLRELATNDDEQDEYSSDEEDLVGNFITTPSQSADSTAEDTDPQYTPSAADTEPESPSIQDRIVSPGPSLAPPKAQAAAESIAPVEITTLTTTETTQTLRSRHGAADDDAPPTSYSTARAVLFANRRKPAPPQTSTATAEAILDQQRAEQDALSDSILKMAGALKASSHKFSSTLEADKEAVGRAGDGMAKTEQSMEAARGRMGTLRRMTEGTGWWGRMLLYAWVYGLMVGLVLLVFVFPKLRF